MLNQQRMVRNRVLELYAVGTTDCTRCHCNLLKANVTPVPAKARAIHSSARSTRANTWLSFMALRNVSFAVATKVFASTTC